MSRLVTKGQLKGKCNICGNERKLTEDHVPPHGVLRFKSVELQHLIPNENNQNRQFQQGVKFRTLCSVCNGDKLGFLYDPELINLSNQVHDYLTSSVALPYETKFNTVPDRVVRSVLGHLMAIGVGLEPRGSLYELASQLVQHPELEIPGDLNVYYWLHPYNYQVAIRQFGFLPKNSDSHVFAAVLKFPPLAFMVTYQQKGNYHLPFYDLVNYIEGNGQTNEIPMSFRESDRPRSDFPEAPCDSDMYFALHGQDSYIAVNKPRILKKKVK